MSEQRSDKMLKGAVTFLDVVGWVGIWQKRTDAISSLSRLTEYLQEEAKTIARGITAPDYSDETKSGISTDVKSISDTIVLLTDTEARKSLEIHGNLCQKVIALSIDWKIPLRGATSFGEFNCEKNIMIGPAIDESAAWHKYTEWFGCMLTPSAFLLNWHKDMDCWKEYDVPTKSGKLKTACVNWVPNFSSSCNLKEKREYLCKTFRDMGPIVPNIEKKYTNTLAYFDACIKDNKK